MHGVIQTEWHKLFRITKLWTILLATVLLNFTILLGDALFVDLVEPAGYRNAGAFLQQGTFEQTSENIQMAAERARALRQLKEFHSGMHSSSDEDTLDALYGDYIKDFQSGSVPLYASNLRSEEIVLLQMRSELDALEEYHAFCENLEENAERLAALVGTSGEKDYAMCALAQQVDVYRFFQDKEPAWQPDYGIQKATHSLWTDGLFFLIALYLTVQAIGMERDHHMNGLLCTVPYSSKVALAKFFVLSAAQLGLAILLYGGNLVCCAIMYGLPRLNLPVQSLAFAAYSPLHSTVGEYFISFVGLKWLAGLALMSVSLLLLLLSKNKLIGTSLVFLHVLIDLVLCKFLPDASRWTSVKHLNTLALWKTEELLDRFSQLPFGGQPFASLFLGLLILVGVILLGLISFLWLFPVGMRLSTPRKRFGLHPKCARIHHRTGLFQGECRKLLLGQKVLFILTGYLLLQMYCAFSASTILMPEQSCYKKAMDGLTGWYDESSYQRLLEQRDEVLPVWEIHRLYFAGQIDSEEFQQFRLMNEDLFHKYEAYQHIRGKKLFYLKMNPGTALVYEPGYEYFLDVDDHKDTGQAILAAFVLLLCFADAGEYERRSSMQLLLQTLPGGWKNMIRTKYKVGSCVACVVGLASLLPQFVYALKAFGLLGLHLPAASLQSFSWLPLWVPLWLLLLGKAILHIAGCEMLAIIITAFALKVGRQIIVLVVAGGIFVLLPLLGTVFSGPLHDWGLYSAFHFLTAWNHIPAAIWCSLFVSHLAVYAWAGYEWTTE